MLCHLDLNPSLAIELPSAAQMRAARALAYLGCDMTFLELAKRTPLEREPSPLPTLPWCYAQMQLGALYLGTDAGKWTLGVARLRGYLDLGGEHLPAG